MNRFSCLTRVLHWPARLVRPTLFLAAATWMLAISHAPMPDPPGLVRPGEQPKYEAYLFAHMIEGNYLYYEQYPGVAYGLSVGASLAGPWFQAAGGQRPDWDKDRMPPKVRHGSMIPISRTQYDTLVTAFGRTPVSVKPSRSD